ncbi:MAG: cytochrome c biogenesis protein [Bradymonadia bacterium]
MKIFPALTALCALAVATAVYFVFNVAPMETSMGVIQKIFYFHVSSAWLCYLGFILCAGGSLGYLWKRSTRADAFALASAEVGLLFGLIVLVTGPLWARPVWGVYWKWEPRLTSMALMVVIFAAYWMLRTFGGSGDGVRRFASVLGVFGAPNIFFVHFAVKMWRGNHPQVLNINGGGGISPDMRMTLYGVALPALLLLFGLLLRLRYKALVDERMIKAMRRRLARAGVF